MSIIWALVNHVLKTIGLPCALKAVPEGLPAAFKKWHQAAYISSLYCIIIIMSGKTHFIITLVSSNVDGEDWIRLLCEECEYVSQTESHRETDRQTDRQTDKGEDEGDLGVLPEWLSCSVVFQPTAAHWRSLSPRRVQTHNVLRRYPHQLYLYSSYPWVWRSPFTSTVLSFCLLSVCQ